MGVSLFKGVISRVYLDARLARRRKGRAEGVEVGGNKPLVAVLRRPEVARLATEVCPLGGWRQRQGRGRQARDRRRHEGRGDCDMPEHASTIVK